MKRILIIDDDQDICRLLSNFLEKKGFETDFVHSAVNALARLKEHNYQLILCDYKLPDVEGIELLKKIKILDPGVPVVIITGYSDVRIAVETLKHGACDYVTKPLYPDEILVTITEAIKRTSERSKVSGESGEKSPSDKFVYGISHQSRHVANHIDLIAPTDMSVIITGETGTGKEFIANAIHQKSKRSEGPFIAIDCGAIPKELAGSELFGHVKGAFTGALNDKTGSFEMANGGTLFLDEIGNLSYENQIKLLRVLQERKIKRIGSNKDCEIDVRIIVATNENLKKSVRENRFREDIYHRLNEFQIEISPIRDRPDDIKLFAEHFLQIANRQLDKNVLGFSECTESAFRNYHWHGNLRELLNVVKRAVLLCNNDYITVEYLPEEIVHHEIVKELEEVGISMAEESDPDDLKSVSENAERQVILSTLKKVGFNKSKAAKALNIDRKTLYNKLKAFDISL